MIKKIIYLKKLLASVFTKLKFNLTLEVEIETLKYKIKNMHQKKNTSKRSIPSF